MTEPTSISTLADLRAALQLAIGLELSTIPVYLAGLYSIEEGHNTDAATVIRGVVMEEMLHMTLAANVLNAIGEVPSTAPVTFQGRPGLSPIPAYPLDSPLITGIGTLELRPLTPEAVDSFVQIEHPLHGAASLAAIAFESGSFRTIGEFYQAVDTALADPAICPDSLFRPVHQIPDSDYYGGAGHIIEVRDRESARAAVLKIIDQGEGLPEQCLHQLAYTVTDMDRLGSGWQMYSHFARFRELQEGRRFRKDQTAEETPKGALLLIDYSAVQPALFTPRNGEWAGSPEGHAMDAFDLAYSRLVDSLYRAFAGEPTAVADPLDGHRKRERPTLQLAVHAMYALKNSAVALMRTPNPAKPGHTLCPRFAYVPVGGDRDKLVQLVEGISEGGQPR